MFEAFINPELLVKDCAVPVAGFPIPTKEDKSTVCITVPFNSNFKLPVSAFPNAPEAYAKFPLEEFGPTVKFKVPVTCSDPSKTPILKLFPDSEGEYDPLISTAENPAAVAEDV